MGLRQAVLRELVRRGVAGGLRERDRIDRAIAELQAQLTPGPLAWDGGRRPEPEGVRAQIAQAEHSRAQVDADLGAAFAAVASAFPPFEIAVRIEAVITLALRDPRIGRGGPESEPVARELDALAARVAAIWAPGLDLARLGAVLTDPAARRRAQRAGLGPPEADARLGWRPMPPDEVLARAANALDGDAFAALCQAARREAAEARDVAERLDAVRASRSTLAVMMGSTTDSISELERLLAREQYEANAAFETAWSTIVRAIQVTPPLRLHAALLAAHALLLRSPVDRTQALAHGRNQLENRTGACGRVMLLAGLAGVRAACDAAFPGLGALAGGGPAEVAALVATAASVDAGPYRAPEARAAHGAPAMASDDAALVELLDRAGAPAVMAQAMTHAVVLGVLDRGGADGLLDQMAVRASPESGDPAATRRARVMWHASVLGALQRSLLAGCVRTELPRVVMHEAIVQVHQAFLGFRATEAWSRAGVHVVGQREAVAAVERLAFLSAASLGVPGDADQIALATAARIAGGAPGPAVVEVLARSLRATPFATALQSLPRLAWEAHDRDRIAGGARNAVPWTDRLNVFSRSAAEEDEDRARHTADEAQRTASDTLRTARDLFSRAVEAHLPLAVHLGIADLSWIVGALRFVPRTSASAASIHGYARAWEILLAWTARAQVALGPLVAPDDVLERYVRARLEARVGFPA